MYYENKARGLCGLCGKPRLDSKSAALCSECFAKAQAAQRKRVEQFKREHKCWDCGLPLPEGHKSLICPKCTQFRTAKNRLLRGESEREGQRIPVVCVETGKRYESIFAAVQAGAGSQAAISRAVRTNKPTRFGLHWKKIDSLYDRKEIYNGK